MSLAINIDPRIFTGKAVLSPYSLFDPGVTLITHLYQTHPSLNLQKLKHEEGKRDRSKTEDAANTSHPPPQNKTLHLNHLIPFHAFQTRLCDSLRPHGAFLVGVVCLVL